MAKNNQFFWLNIFFFCKIQNLIKEIVFKFNHKIQFFET